MLLFSAVPPERPTAPKPVQQQRFPAATFDVPQEAIHGMPGSLGQPSVMGMLPSSEAPKLKDFLPFMKPGSFGRKGQVGSHASTVSNDCAPGSAGSLPSSISASPVHLPQASVSFPPSPQRQLPSSVSVSNGYGEVMRPSGTSFAHAEAGYPVAEGLLSPTAPPGAPRSASPLPQQPPTVAHPGGPGESQQLPRTMDMSYNIPQNYNQSSIGQSPISVTGRVSSVSAGYAGPSEQMIGQPPSVSMSIYTGSNVHQPALYTQHALPGNISAFQSQIPGHCAVVSSNVAPSTTGAHPHHGGLPYAANVQPANIPGVPVQQVNNSNNAFGSYPSTVEDSKPHYYQTPVPPTCTAIQLPHQSVQRRPPSYEVVTQHYPPPTQPVSFGYPSTGLPSSISVDPGLAAPVHGVHPEVSYANANAGQLSASHHQQVTNMQPRHSVPSQPQQLPPSQQIMPSNQRPIAPPQHPVMPYMEQQPQQINQNQPRYPTASQTVPGLPMPTQHPGVSQTPSPTSYTANVHMPASQPQPRYPPVPNTAYSYPAGVQQFQPAYQHTGQQPVANQMEPMHTTASHMQPACTSQKQQYQHYPIQPSRPELHMPESQPQPRYPGTGQVCPASNQPTSAYHQPTVNSQQMQYPQQQQPLYHPGSSQPPVVNQSAVVSSNFNTPQTPYSNQHQPHTTAAYSHNVNNAPADMQAFADIPVCLPSPLQPSRVTAAEVSKNVDSLRDLDLSGKTSSADDAHPKQTDSSGKQTNVDIPGSKDVSTDSSTNEVDQREKLEEETRRSLHRSTSSRDVYADSDTLMRFVAEVEKFQKHVDSLVKPTLGGYFPLDKEWKV